MARTPRAISLTDPYLSYVIIAWRTSIPGDPPSNVAGRAGFFPEDTQ